VRRMAGYAAGMHAILIWIDQLPYELLGCYGNLEADTPGFDRFAARSVTFDNCYVTDLRDDPHAALSAPLFNLAQQGVVVRVRASNESALVNRLQERTIPGGSVEVSPSPEVLTEAVTRSVQEAMDGDRGDSVLTLFSISHIAGDTKEAVDVGDASATGPLALADHLVGHLADLLENCPAPESLLTLVGAASGIEPAVTEESSDRSGLSESKIHVPLLGRTGSGLQLGLRSGALVTIADVAARIQAHFLATSVGGTEVEAEMHYALSTELCGAQITSREQLVLRAADDWYGLRTSEWFLTCRIPAGFSADSWEEAAESASLFAKPDDRFECLDVAAQSPNVVAELTQRLLQSVCRTGG